MGICGGKVDESPRQPRASDGQEQAKAAQAAQLRKRQEDQKVFAAAAKLAETKVHTIQEKVPPPQFVEVFSFQKNEALEMAIETSAAQVAKEEREAKAAREQYNKEQNDVKIATQSLEKEKEDVERAQEERRRIKLMLEACLERGSMRRAAELTKEHREIGQEIGRKNCSVAEAAAFLEKETKEAQEAQLRKRKEDKKVFAAAAKLARAEKAHSDYRECLSASASQEVLESPEKAR